MDQLVTLREPFSALRIRLQVMDRTRSDLVNITCWSMAFLGCAASEGIALYIRQSLCAACSWWVQVGRMVLLW